MPPARKRYAGLGHHHRNWESEPLLEEREPPGSSSSRTAVEVAEVKAAASSTLMEKEKSKAMLSVERGKLMKSIKEVNESDLSENSTPVNSPAPQLMAVPRDGSVSQASFECFAVEFCNQYEFLFLALSHNILRA